MTPEAKEFLLRLLPWAFPILPLLLMYLAANWRRWMVERELRRASKSIGAIPFDTTRGKELPEVKADADVPRSVVMFVKSNPGAKITVTLGDQKFGYIPSTPGWHTWRSEEMHYVPVSNLILDTKPTPEDDRIEPDDADRELGWERK